MLRVATELMGYSIGATDGLIGKVDDVYFDDNRWAVRYLVADTGGWLSDRKVLITPISIGQPDWLSRMLPVTLTKKQVEHSPSIDTHKPVSRQHEAAYMEYYGYPFYWSGDSLWGIGAYPGHLSLPAAIKTDLKKANRKKQKATNAGGHRLDHHLRSSSEAIGHHVQATDGEIGHVSDFLIDDLTWAIRYLVVNTSNWWLGHKVLIAPNWIGDVSWSDAKVHVNVTQKAVQKAPAYDADAVLDRQREDAIHKHYGRQAYWELEPVTELMDLERS
jgi:uncharacterized protein YrrD